MCPRPVRRWPSPRPFPECGLDALSIVVHQMSKMMTGLRPRGFVWVIAERLAVSERIGGVGFQHRRVRREEEIVWLTHEAHITAVVTLLAGNQNVSAYLEAGLATHPVPVQGEITPEVCRTVYAALDEALSHPDARVLVHREVIDDEMAGLLGGYLVHAGLIGDPVLAVAVIQEILGRPLGPTGRSLVQPSGT